MRRGWKIFWIVCASIAGIGLVLCVTGAGMGATLSGIGEVYASDRWFTGMTGRDGMVMMIMTWKIWMT